MKKPAFTILLLAISLFFLSVHSLQASENDHLLKSGDLSKSQGKDLEAARYYQEYILNHPFTTESAPPKKRQRAVHNLLRAYTHLLDILRDQNQLEARDEWLMQLLGMYDSMSFRSKQRYTLARILQANDWIETSISLYEKIIDDQLHEYQPGNNTTFLSAVARLTNIHAKRGDIDSINSILSLLRSCPTENWTEKDSLKRARLIVKYDRNNGEANRELRDLITNIDDPKLLTTRITAAIQLLSSHEQDTPEELLKTIKIVENLESVISQPSQLYKLSLAYFKHGRKDKAIRLLSNISTDFSETIWARKSLFLLGRTALCDEDWDAAIQHFSNYIERYPDQIFFCLKAYSKLLDAYWARDGYLAEQDVEMQYFADILNQTSNYETQLNFSRDLKYKGYHQLADSTFILGYSSAQEELKSAESPIKKMRILWQVTKYAYQTGKIDLAKESGETVVMLYNELKAEKGFTKHQTKAGHYLSRTYLWLAKSYEDTGEILSAIALLEDFIAQFPQDADIEYATIQLAINYERLGDPISAAALYETVKNERWKDTATQALERITSQ